MIIKFKSGKRWVFFEGEDHLEYEELSKEPGGADSTILQFDPPESMPGGGPRMVVSFFTKNATERTVIFAHSPIYLMNDQGRTVETI